MSNLSGKNQRSILLLAGSGLGLILATALSYFMDNPGLVQHTSTGTPVSVSQQPVSVQNEMPDGVVNLMRRLQDAPNDMDALTALAQHFIHTQEWDKAETFALRAVLSAPNDPRPLHTLGIIQHSTGRNEEAASSLEKALGMKSDPSTCYSLGILHAYYLDNPDKGITYLKQVLAAPESPEDLKDAVINDIKQIEAHKAHMQSNQ